MERDDLTATSWFASRAFVAVLWFAGLFFLFRPDWLGWGWLVERCGGETRVLGAGLFGAFAVLALLTWEKGRMRIRMAETTEALHQLLYGKDYRRDREAVEILLTALESSSVENAENAHKHLMRLTGQNFGRDPKVWRSWWEANKKVHERKG